MPANSVYLPAKNNIQWGTVSTPDQVFPLLDFRVSRGGTTNLSTI